MNSAIVKASEITPMEFASCHEGVGTLLCRAFLKGDEGRAIGLMHDDHLLAGVSIGEHRHDNNEEIYFLLSGRGILTFDGQKYDMEMGDFSFCTAGHSHGFEAIEDCRLLVIGTR